MLFITPFLCLALGSKFWAWAFLGIAVIVAFIYYGATYATYNYFNKEDKICIALSTFWAIFDIIVLALV